MPTRLEDLKAEVLAAPDDDEPRLVAADWLDEQGDPRGEFIRVQCELEQIEQEEFRTIELSKRELKMLKQYGSEWRKSVSDRVAKAKLYRGFIEHVQCGVRQFIRDGASVLQEEPIRTTLLTALSPKSLDDFLASDGLPLIRELSFSTELSTQEWKRFGSCSRFDRLEGIHLTSQRLLSPQWQALLGQAPFVEQLKILNAGSYISHVFDAKILAAGHRFHALEELDLEKCAIPSSDLLAMLGGDHPKLKRLNLQNLKTEAGHSECLIQAMESLPQLECLKFGQTNALRRTQITFDQTSSVPARAEHLNELDFRKCTVSESLVIALLTEWDLPKLKRLDLCGTGTTAEILSQVSHSETFRRLATLSLAENNLKQPILIELVQAGAFDNVRILDLCRTGAASSLGTAILEREELQFTHLDLSENRIPNDLQKSLRKRFGTGVCKFSRN